MTYKKFLETLEELELDIDSAAEALDLEVSDIDRKSTRLNSSHPSRYRMPSSA